MKKIAVTAIALVANLGFALPTDAIAQTPDETSNAGTAVVAEPQIPQAVEEGAPPYATIQVASPAQPAADVAPPSAAEISGIEEVLVTARRTAENLQDVPVAISAFSAADLQREQINNAQDLQGRVPSLVIGTGGQMRNTETPTIRGQGSTLGAGPGVVIYFAEVPLPIDSYSSGQGGPGKFFDISSLQVLKGSQGTLFGRNTTGGALLIEPHKPEDSFSASLRAEGSNYSGNGYEAVLNTPLIEDKLLLRVAAKYFDREGFTTDVATGKDYDSKHFWTARLGLTWKPTGGVENYLLGYYTRSDDNGTANVIQQWNPEGLNTGILAFVGLPALPPVLPPGLGVGCVYLNLLAPSTNCGADIVAEQQARGVRRVQLSANPNDILETGGVNDQLSIELNDQLTLRNIASYQFYKHHFRWDLDGSRAAWADIGSPDDELNSSDSGVYTEELQLQGTALDGRLKFVVGGYYEYGEPEGPQVNPATVLFMSQVVTSGASHTAYGPYAQGTYDLGGLTNTLDGLNLTLGARYSVDEIEGYYSTGGGLTAARSGKPKIDSSAPTWTVGLDYTVDATLLYGKISRGYKSGGLSLTAADPDHFTFKPEFVTNYEVGFKSDFDVGTMPARVNAAVYYTDYTDLQRTGSDSYSAPGQVQPTFGAATANAGKAKIQGVELEGSIKPFTGATLMANYAYTDGKYEEYVLTVGSLNPQRDCSGGDIQRGGVANLACIPFQSTPRNQYSVTARYELPAMDVGRIEGSVTYSWTDEQYTSPFSPPEAEPGAWLAAYGLLNASLRWQVFNTALDLMLYGTNLTDKEYRVSNSNVWNQIYFRNSIYGEPRIVGLQLGYRFGD